MVLIMTKLMLLNLGSTSFKFKLYEVPEGGEVGCAAAEGGVDSIGAAGSDWRMRFGQHIDEGRCICVNHEAAFATCLKRLQESGVLDSIETLDAVGYKAVHGGPNGQTCFVDAALMETMERYAPLASTHNPIYLSMMKIISKTYPSLRQIACFETSFHETVPLHRAVYGVPYEWVQEYGIRRYGFHGSSHQYIAWKMKELSPGANRLISVHLGGSSTLCAIKEGQSIATSMGATPQGGLFNNNRVGDFDAFCIPFLVQTIGDSDSVMRALAAESGLLGLSGISGDLRAVLEAKEAGVARAELAVKALVDNTVGYIGMFAAYLGGLDAIVFTGGIGWNSDIFRKMVCAELNLFKIVQQEDAAADGRDAFVFSKPESPVALWAVRTDEEYVLAKKSLELLGAR
jgi:acetate kinase